MFTDDEQAYLDFIYPGLLAFARQIGARVTPRPITLTFSDNMEDGLYALIWKVHDPKVYEIEFNAYSVLRDRNLALFRDIIIHELAHLKYPIAHTIGFSMLYKDLGGGPYAFKGEIV